MVGTDFFKAPEVTTGKYTFSADVYSLGKCMQVMICCGLTLNQTCFQRYPKELVDIVDQMVSINPCHRPSAAHVRKASNDHLTIELNKDITQYRALFHVLKVKQKELTNLQEIQKRLVLYKRYNIPEILNDLVAIQQAVSSKISEVQQLETDLKQREATFQFFKI